MRTYTILIWLFSTISLSSQTYNASEILNHCLDYHDFNNHIFNKSLIFCIDEYRPDKSLRSCTLNFDPQNEFYYIRHIENNNSIEYILQGENITIFYNKSSSISADIIKKYNLTNQRAIQIKNYYYYLWYLPMKLKDIGTDMTPTAKIEKEGDDSFIVLDVNYPGEIKNHNWRFYLDPQNHQLRKYLFYTQHLIDGEYVLLKDEIEFDGIRIPSSRAWYTSAEGKFLGEDILIKIEEGRLK